VQKFTALMRASAEENWAPSQLPRLIARAATAEHLAGSNNNDECRRTWDAKHATNTAFTTHIKDTNAEKLPSSHPPVNDNTCPVPTKAESRALAFFAGLFAFGAAVRLASQFRHPDPAPDTASSAALTQHVAAVDAARSSGVAPKARSSGTRRTKAGALAPDSAPPPPVGVPPELAALAGWFTRTPPKRAVQSPAAGSGKPRQQGRLVAPGESPSALAPAEPTAPTVPVDLDLADEAAIEALPGIGPSLARRIVADRALNGPFGSAEALGRVKGVGAVLQARLAPRVTFSGSARPP
jgi:hypothetical protein